METLPGFGIGMFWGKMCFTYNLSKNDLLSREAPIVAVFKNSDPESLNKSPFNTT